MHIKSVYILIGALLLTLCINVQRANGQAIVPKNITIPNDSLDEEMFLKGDTALKTRENKAKNDSLYILDIPNKRHHNYGNTFTRAWDDHLFVQVGAGIEQMLSPTENYRFNPLTTLNLGAGKQFDRYHSLRFIVNGGFGYQHDKDYFFARLGGRIDHLFNVSSYFDGYAPTRVVNISTIAGVGYHHSQMQSYRKSHNFEGHVGLQFRFFTGPQGYVNIEPHIGIAQDSYDLSEIRNWRSYDVFYGANLNFIYYLHNNLSPEDKEEYLSRKPRYARSARDKNTLDAWQSPFFVEISNGLNILDSPNIDHIGTLGHNMVASLGKWFSPAIGLRMSLSSSNFTWNKERTPASLSPVRPAYTNKLHSHMYGIGVEAMLNPLGFKKDYSWNQVAGFHFLFGGELGWLTKVQDEKLSCHAESYTAGLQVWAKLHEGLHLFLEPRFASTTYKIPYSNVNWNKRFSDESYSLNLGVSMQLRARKFIEPNTEEENNNLSFGLGGGFTLLTTKSHYKGDKSIKWNASAYATYHLDRYSGARLGLEYLSISDNIMSEYTDYNLEFPEIDYAQTIKEGLWKRTFHVGILSAGYTLNLTNLFTHSDNCRWNLDLYAGPSLAILFGESNKMNEMERKQPNHKYAVKGKAEMNYYIGANAGLNLSYDINKKVQIFLSPTFYAFKKFDIPECMTHKYMILETINAGVQYSF